MNENNETWLVGLWLGNEYGSYYHWQARADKLLEMHNENKTTLLLAEEIKRAVSNHPLIDSAGLYNDLLSDALRQVDWHNVARSFLDE